ncbi:expressed unknown protein [Seminavis robusta]|uniref:Uncharacterized protein n=1 Tax=Seminavis robusta TaxID=568900 RepID=A0A9N8HF36_9STRA|nr:expressed unknown protein [Seminavis robusta]|eukprot:Sro548_g164430.1 n/a (288) ;mRNA; r:35799-36662
MKRQDYHHNKAQEQDNIPQRPFRRLSGCSNGLRSSCTLFSVKEDDCCNYNTNKKCLKDAPPKKPCSASTIMDDTSTVPTYLDDNESMFSEGGGSVKFPTPSQKAHYEQVKAREAPNAKASTVPIDATTDNIILQQRKRMVEGYWETLRQRDLDQWRNLVTDDYQMVCVGSRGKVTRVLTHKEILPAARAVFDALPDFKFMYRDIQEHKELPGCLVLKELVASGTHTGAPFALGPLPPIPATGKFIVLDECENHFHFDPHTNKIRKMEEIAMGEITGIPGVYALLSRP